MLNMQQISEVLVNGVRKRHHSLTDLSKYLHTIACCPGPTPSDSEWLCWLSDDGDKNNFPSNVE